MSGSDLRVLVTLPHGLREDFFTAEARRRLESLADVDYNGSDDQFTPDELADRLSGADAVVTGWGTPEFTAEVLADAADLELLAHTGGSVATYASDPLYDRGVTVCSANRPMARFVAELTMAHVLGSQRGLVGAHESIRAGEYESIRPGRTLLGGTVGLVGLGTVGRYLLALLAPFDVDVRLYDPYVPPVEVAEYGFVEKTTLEGALDAEVVSIHASRTPETVGMIGAEELAAIPDGALLVNTARAELVDREALQEALSSGRIRAALDVYHEEPLPEDGPLRDLENVQLTPHLGGHGPHEVFAETMVEEVERYFGGRALQHEIPREQADLMTR